MAGLKLAASKRIRSYTDFYDLLGRGFHPEAETLLGDLTPDLPEWVLADWRRRLAVFRGNLYRRGLCARVFELLRGMAGVDGRWLRDLARRPVEARQEAIDRQIVPVLRSPAVARWIQSLGQLLALGINYAQQDRLLRTWGTDMIGFVEGHLKRVASTDLTTNWFAWLAIAGHLHHEVEAAVPPYLRRESHRRSTSADTRIQLRHQNLLEVVDRAPAGSWSHFLLCDAVDWMPTPVQRRLFDGMARAGRPGARVLVRSVEATPVVSRLGLDRRFRRLDQASDHATARDRTRQYTRVDVYELVA